MNPPMMDSIRALGIALAVSVAVLLGGCALTVPQEQVLGAQLAHETTAQLPLLEDEVVVGYVRDLADELLRGAGPQPFVYRVYVVVDDDVNAFAMPGGHVYVNTGLILAARNVSELAGVMGHEIGHVVLRHLAENYGRQQAASITRNAVVLGTAVAGGPSQAVALATDLTLVGVLNTFGREAERQADAFAIEVMPRAGYDPEGMVSFFQALAQQGSASVPTFLSSHPPTQERAVAAREAIRAQGVTPGLRTSDGGRLEIIQRRIRLLTGER